MIVYKDLVQVSPEWFEIKWGKIGGSLSKGLFVDSETLLIDLISQLCEEFEYLEDGFTNASMERGNDLEPFARGYLEKYLGIEFKQVGWLQCEKNMLLGISPDGITEDETESCEIKCLGRKAHMKILLDNMLPIAHTHQCIHYFTVNPNLKKLHFLAFRPEAVKHYIKTLTLDSIVNIGTEKKPKLITIKEASEYARSQADMLLKQINEKIELLKF